MTDRDYGPPPIRKKDLEILMTLYDYLVSELLRIDPRCELSGWDTNEESKAAVDRLTRQFRNRRT